MQAVTETKVLWWMISDQLETKKARKLSKGSHEEMEYRLARSHVGRCDRHGLLIETSSPTKDGTALALSYQTNSKVCSASDFSERTGFRFVRSLVSKAPILANVRPNDNFYRLPTYSSSKMWLSKALLFILTLSCD